MIIMQVKLRYPLLEEVVFFSPPPTNHRLIITRAVWTFQGRDCQLQASNNFLPSSFQMARTEQLIPGIDKQRKDTVCRPVYPSRYPNPAPSNKTRLVEYGIKQITGNHHIITSSMNRGKNFNEIIKKTNRTKNWETESGNQQMSVREGRDKEDGGPIEYTEELKRWTG